MSKKTLGRRTATNALPGVMMVIVVLVALSNLQVTQQAKRDELPPLTQLGRFQLESQLASEWSAVGRWFASTAAADSSLLTIAIGAVGFCLGADHR